MQRYYVEHELKELHKTNIWRSKRSRSIDNIDWLTNGRSSMAWCAQLQLGLLIHEIWAAFGAAVAYRAIGKEANWKS